MASTKVIGTFRAVGRRQFAAWVEKDIELARILAARMRRQPDFRILGPNTLGVMNSFSGFTTSFMPVTRQRVSSRVNGSIAAPS